MLVVWCGLWMYQMAWCILWMYQFEKIMASNRSVPELYV